MTDGTTPTAEPLTRKLPDIPSYMKPLPDPILKEGDDQFRTALVYKQKFRQANKIIVSGRKWYIGVQKNYSKAPKKPGWFSR